MYSLLSDDLWWLLIGYSLLDALFLIWLFPCLVVYECQYFTWLTGCYLSELMAGIIIWLFIIFITFFTIFVNCWDLCQKSQFGFLVSAKNNSLNYCASDLSWLISWFSVKNKKEFNKHIIFNTYTDSWKHNISCYALAHLLTSIATCLLPVLCLFWYSIYC